MNLYDAAAECLACSDPAEKASLTHHYAELFRNKKLTPHSEQSPEPIRAPGRPERPKLVSPKQLAQRGLGSKEGRAAFLHAIAHIEFNAINLAWDAAYRFRDMPEQFYVDWVQVADDEARHFQLLAARLGEFGYAYGDFDAHNGLWEMCEKTAHSCLERMALVPRVLEARGLDVSPAMIERLRQHGDEQSAAIIEVILREEVAHVAAGTRWYLYCCEQENIQPLEKFHELIREHARGALRGPFNYPARQDAGFNLSEMKMIEDLSSDIAKSVRQSSQP
jgi:uncharacterized ferritin-like protein (DUF455 family)